MKLPVINARQKEVHLALHSPHEYFEIELPPGVYYGYLRRRFCLICRQSEYFNDGKWFLSTMPAEEVVHAFNSKTYTLAEPHEDCRPRVETES